MNMFSKRLRVVLFSLTAMSVLVSAFVLARFPALAQSGGSFVIEKSVIGGGGGQAAGGSFTLDGTIGQPFGGTTSSGGTFQVGSGFWGGGGAAAASVSVSGRVTTPDGRGLRNAVVKLTDVQGTRSTTTSSFGLYSFDNVQTGQQITVRVLSKLYRFSTAMVQVNSTDLTDLNFTGVE